MFLYVVETSTSSNFMKLKITNSSDKGEFEIGLFYAHKAQNSYSLLVARVCYFRNLKLTALIFFQWIVSPVNKYIPKVNNANTRERREICSRLIIKTSERHH